MSDHARRMFSGNTTDRGSMEPSPEKATGVAHGLTTLPKSGESEEIRRLKAEMTQMRTDLETRFSLAAKRGDGTPAQDTLAQAISVQTEALQAALKAKVE